AALATPAVPTNAKAAARARNPAQVRTPFIPIPSLPVESRSCGARIVRRLWWGREALRSQLTRTSRAPLTRTPPAEAVTSDRASPVARLRHQTECGRSPRRSADPAPAG